MKESSRCLYNSNFNEFIREDSKTVLGILCDNYHVDAMTTTREAWKYLLCKKLCHNIKMGR